MDAIIEASQGGRQPKQKGVTLFVSGLKVSDVMNGYKKALSAAFKPFGGARIKVGRNERGHTCGYAWVTLPSSEAAEAAVASMDGQLQLRFTVGVEKPGRPPPYNVVTPMLSVGVATDKRDILYPDLPRSARLRLRFDGVALFSVTDSVTADRLAEILGTIVQAAAAPGRGRVGVVDAFACVGGSAAALARRGDLFRSVVAVELDPVRAAHLRHNLDVALAHGPWEIGECTAEGGGPRDPARAAQERAMVVQGDAVSTLLSPLLPPPPSSRISDLGTATAAVRGAEVVFLDPPWGGTSYGVEGLIRDFRLDAPEAPSASATAEAAIDPMAPAATGSGNGAGAMGVTSLVLALGRRRGNDGNGNAPKINCSRCQIAALRLPVNYGSFCIAEPHSAINLLVDPVTRSRFVFSDVDGLARALTTEGAVPAGLSGNRDDRPLPYILKLGPKALLFIVCFTPPPPLGDGDGAGAPRSESLGFGLGTLDDVIGALNAKERGPWRGEHSPKFFDFEADRWIRCRDWKGCFSP